MILWIVLFWFQLANCLYQYHLVDREWDNWELLSNCLFHLVDERLLLILYNCSSDLGFLFDCVLSGLRFDLLSIKQVQYMRPSIMFC